MTLTADEFLRRFLLHVLPQGFVRIRHFGLLANRRREDAAAALPACSLKPSKPVGVSAPNEARICLVVSYIAGGR